MQSFTLWANPFPYRQVLYILINIPALMAPLGRRYPAADFLEVFAGTFHFVLYHCQERGPPYRGNRLRKVAVLHHVFYCKVFTDKCTAAVGNDARKLVVEVFSLICGLPLLCRNPQPGFFPVLRPCMGLLVILFPGKCLLESPQPSGMDFYPARVLDGFGAFQVPKHTKHL